MIGSLLVICVALLGGSSVTATGIYKYIGFSWYKLILTANRSPPPAANMSPSPAVNRSPPTCSDGWQSYGRSCYTYSTSKVSFGEAVAICLAAGAKLAEPETAEENQFLRDIARDQNITVWIGGTDIFHEGKWVFLSTKQSFGDLPYSLWNNNEPDNGGGSEDCLTYSSDYSYRWSDASCTRQLNFICEADGDAVVAPNEC